jgi:spermidine synthase
VTRSFRILAGDGRLPIIFACFFLSGATGLIYQVVWLRMLGLVFGHTVYAITTVLAAFMGGLALGSYLFARVSARIRNLIGAYGWLEIGIGVSCALIPLLVGVTSALYLSLHRAFGFSYDTFNLAQFALGFVLLLVPTTLMGGTLPVLSQAFVTQGSGLGQKVGALYATNTFGAVVGVVLAGYLVLPALGIRLTVAIAAAANLLVGALAIALSRRWPLAPTADTEPQVVVRKVAGATPAFDVARLPALLTVGAIGLSGAASMIYEVAWTRALALVIGSSTYAFTSMLLAFLVGIAGGSALYSWLWGRRRALLTTFAKLQVGIAAAVIMIVLLFERMPELFLAALGRSDSPPFIQVVQFLVSAASLLPSTLLIGATFPCAIAIVARPARVGADVGHVYAVNTLGAIAGTLLAGFLLIPTLGVHGSLKLGVGLNLIIAAGLVLASPPRRRGWQGVAVVAALAAAVLMLPLLPPWDHRVMASGPAVYGKKYLKEASQHNISEVLRRHRILFYRDGVSGTISVHDNGQHLFLRTNGKTDAGTGVDMPTQLMSGHLPMLLHSDPKRVVVIGMGSGITAGSVARYPIEHLDIVEIEPAVVEASRFFASEHGNVLADPRVRVVIADARNFLLTTPQRYDVIISEPSNPWVGGLAALFSVEFFTLAREHLQPGGIMLQWVQGYNLYTDDLQMVVRTFRSVFPATTIWNTIEGDFLLIGRVESMPFDLTTVQERFQTNPGVWRAFDRFGIRAWPGALGYFMLGERDTARFAGPGRLNTDDLLPLEFSAPRALYADTTTANWRSVRSFRTEEFPPLTLKSRAELDHSDARYWVGAGYFVREVLEDALANFQRALEIEPDHVPSLLLASRVSTRSGNPAAGFDLALRALARVPQSAEANYLAGLAAEALGRRVEARAHLQRALALQPQHQDYKAALERVASGGR